ncbi:MAG: prephenate dehydrogenase/arogenate dehydrogenase family protein [Anaerolineae bacterium]|nr:prephenate dehydrogenase/arogenate dehydrogenase family protein [Anaerolineae bacterium]MDW8070168.1 prephenate dehydrogenase/arogenate dehydrogenase family protein [Anaerolineae bacterium]
MGEKAQVTIVGTGCIGTSIGLALHRVAQPLEIVGHDKNADHVGIARKMKAIDRSDWNLINACENADLIILALPLHAIEATLTAIAPYLKPGCVVTDTAVLKQKVLDMAERLLPETVNFVGGNPLVSSSASGPQAASPSLFEGHLYCLTPSRRAHPEAVHLVSSLIMLLGARPFYLDATEHDGLVAGAFHLPQLLALALWRSVTTDCGWRDMRKLIGGNYDTIGSLIGEDADTLCDELLSNRAHLLAWVDSFMEQVRALRALLAEGTLEPLLKSSEQAIAARHQWLVDQSKLFSEELPMPPIEKPNLLHYILPRRLIEKR